MKFLPEAMPVVETFRRTISSLALLLGAVYIQLPLPCWVFYTESCPSKAAPSAPCETSVTDQLKSLQLHQLSLVRGTRSGLCSSCKCYSTCLRSAVKGYAQKAQSMDVANLLPAFASQLQVLEWSMCLWPSLGGGRRGAGQATHLEDPAGAAECLLCVESGISRARRWQTRQEKAIAGKPQITSFLPLMKMRFIFEGFSIKTKHLGFFSEMFLGCVQPVGFMAINLNI